jgi:hypothetical protein
MSAWDVLSEEALRVLVLGVAWVPMDRRMRLKEAALADIHVMSLVICEVRLVVRYVRVKNVVVVIMMGRSYP